MSKTNMEDYYNAYVKCLHETVEHYGEKYGDDPDKNRVEKEVYEDVLYTIVDMSRKAGKDITPSFVFFYVIGMNHALLSHGYMAINNPIPEITQDALDVQRENE